MLIYQNFPKKLEDEYRILERIAHGKSRLLAKIPNDGSIIHMEIKLPILFNLLRRIREKHKKTSSFIVYRGDFIIFLLFYLLT
jgi:hypothetical protein